MQDVEKCLQFTGLASPQHLENKCYTLMAVAISNWRIYFLAKLFINHEDFIVFEKGEIIFKSLWNNLPSVSEIFISK